MKKKRKMIRKEVLLLVACLGAWMTFAVRQQSVITRGTRNLFLAFAGRTLEEKKRAVDRGYYDFMMFVSANVPQDASVLFYARESDYLNYFPRDSAPIYLDMQKKKSGYYLYPRRVYTDTQTIPGDADYIVVFLGEYRFDGFSTAARFARDAYILKREGS